MTKSSLAQLVVALVLSGVFAALLYQSYQSSRQLKRAEFIRTYRWPRGLLRKLMDRHPGIQLKDAALVSRGLRQFFIAYLMSDKKFVSMPSVVADDLWHEFILYTRDYEQFCKRAFGTFMHHSPAAILSEERKTNVGLRRVWWYCCKYENIDPYNPTRVPLLFALDLKLNIPGGFRYYPQCEELRKGGDGSAYCGGDFGNPGIDGNTAGLGDGGHRGHVGGCGGGGPGDGGSCGSGCGGGGD